MKIRAIIEKASDGTYSIYHAPDNLGFLVTATGKNLDEAKEYFIKNYQEIKDYKISEGKVIEDIEWIWYYDIASI